MLESPLVKRGPLGTRLTLVLEEKQKVVKELLAYLRQEELPEYAAMVEWLKVIYRDDETEKLHFQDWKRVSLQKGAFQSADATAACVAINNLHLMRGLIGKPGSGPLHMAGQPSSSSNRTVGGVGTYPGNRNPENPDHLRDIARLWNVEESSLAVGPEKGIIKQIELMEKEQIGFFWNIHTNPLVSLPNLPRVKKAMEKPFVVVQDPFLTETTKVAMLYFLEQCGGRRKERWKRGSVPSIY
ncbi:Molybdopterin oxidoreductase [Alteribacillus bidgolensis]|uniref:Molybdopterin oxidoreductase n=1 Tax=Alteribacillus bidgolensis TaxID=930129 RepID=A0A1G8NPZ7_9BACI|nr:Molybdopterin oxidoreductase [Alteribacillus bidgolensis]